MTETQESTANILIFWLVAILALAWNGMGCLNFYWQMTPSGMQNLPAEYRDFANDRPFWATAAFGVSVVAGLIGAILMIMRRKVAASAFILSGLGALIAAIPTIGHETSSFLVGAVMSAAMAFFFAWIAKRHCK